jgi:hypothetical protein
VNAEPFGRFDPFHGFVADNESLAKLQLPLDLADVEVFGSKQRVRYSFGFAGELHVGPFPHHFLL